MPKLVLILEEGIPRGFYSDTPGTQCTVVYAVDIEEELFTPEQLAELALVKHDEAPNEVGYAADPTVYPYEVEEI